MSNFSVMPAVFIILFTVIIFPAWPKRYSLNLSSGQAKEMKVEWMMSWDRVLILQPLTTSSLKEEVSGNID